MEEVNDARLLSVLRVPNPAASAGCMVVARSVAFMAVRSVRRVVAPVLPMAEASDAASTGAVRLCSTTDFV
ncbi:hypothetical protein V7S43_018541 [Phytophthora oleae]|uniref:Uncharacterized protein n=1 Tax=Phytophthora oleae TaxID=2107226 RepID=A0ABD3ETN7_9STRA